MPYTDHDPKELYVLNSMYDLMWSQWRNGIPDIAPQPDELLFARFIDAMQYVWERSQKADQADMNAGPAPEFVDIALSVFECLDRDGLKVCTKIFNAIEKDFVTVRFFNPKNPKEVYTRITLRHIAKNLIAAARKYMESSANAEEDVKAALAPAEEAAKKLKAPQKRQEVKEIVDTSGADSEEIEDENVSFIKETPIEEQAEGLPAVNCCQRYESTDVIFQGKKKQPARFRCAGDYMTQDGSRCTFAEANPNTSSTPGSPLCAFKVRNDKVPATNPMAWLCNCEDAHDSCTEKFEIKNGQPIITALAKAS